MATRGPNRISKQSPAKPAFTRTVGVKPPSPAEAFNAIRLFPTQVAGAATTAQTGGVAGLASGSPPTAPTQGNITPSGTTTLAGDVVGDPDANLIQSIQGQPLAGTLGTGQAFIGEGGVLVPTVPVQPYVIGGESVGNVPVWNGTAYAPGVPASTPSPVSAKIVSSAYNVLPTDTWIEVDTTAGNVPVNLPAANTWTGGVLYIGKQVAANQVVINPNGTDTLNDVNSNKNIIAQYITLVIGVRADGTGWFISSMGAV